MVDLIEKYRDLIVLWVRLVALTAIVAVLALFAGFIASQANGFWRWTIGLGFATIVGHFACWYFLHALRTSYMRLSKPNVLGRSRGVPTSVMGVFERILFTVAVGVYHTNLGGVLAAMGVWLGNKILAKLEPRYVRLLEHATR